MKGKRIFLASLLIVLFAMLTSLFVVDTYAENSRKVKVGFFPMEGYHIVNKDGSYDGMDVRYLDAIKEYVGWDIEYVVCDSWEDALNRLENKEIDLVGSAQFSEERALKFDYADLSSGYTFGVIATTSNSVLAYEDFEAIADVKIGMVKGYVRSAEFYEYMNNNGISDIDVIEYDSTSQMQDALNKGEIQAYVHTFTEVRDGQRLIGRFSPRPFYYISYKGNSEVMAELNKAISDVKFKKPALEAELMNEFYYNRFDNASLLTVEEKKYIATMDGIKVGYLTDIFPFSYEKDGEFKGLTKNLLLKSLRSIGVSAEYKKYNSIQEGMKALEAGEIDMLSYGVVSKSVYDNYDFIKLCDYVSSPLVLVHDKDKNAKSIKSIAIVDMYLEEYREFMDVDDLTVVKCNNQADCFEELRKKSVDAVLVDGYYAENVIKNDYKNRNLEIENALSGEYNVSMLMNKDTDKALIGILSKIISPIEPNEISEYILKEGEYKPFNLNQFIQENSMIIIALMFAVIIIIVLVARHIINDGRKIQKLMYRDSVYDIWNMNYLIFWGEHRILPEARQAYAVVYTNISQFRRYNIIYGWSAGEKIIKCLIDVINKNTDKNTEICARQQGDRFCMLLAYENKEEFEERLENLRRAIEKHIKKVTNNKMKVQFGVYYLQDNKQDLRLAGNYANQALEHIGDSKTETIKYYDENLENIIKERHEKEKLLEAVDVNKDFVVYYQSKVDIRSGEIVGAEALVRFADPTDGGKIKAPGFFVPYYEQTGRIIDIDFFVFESVCKLIRRRLDEHKKVVVVSCNFSRMHFVRSGFAEKFEGILNKYNIPKDLIEIEITETLVVEELQHNMVKKTLEVIKEKGFRLSIDDFGAGYSSLGVFEQIPASVIKLDRSFLLNQEDRDRQVKIMRGIVKLTKELEAQVVCEGVENENDVELMKEIGAYVAQGYFYSKPIPESEFEQRLDDNKAN